MSDFDKRFPPVPPVPPVPPPPPVPPHRQYPHPKPFPHRHRKPLNHVADFAPMIMHPHIPHHFNFWCNKVIPMVYDDGLSYYEVLAKTADYMNNLINDVKMGAINIEELAQAFCELQRFVNDYFAWYQSKGLINYEIAITNDNYEKYLPDLDVAQMNTVYRFKFVEGSEQTLPNNLPDAAKPFSGAECVLFNLSNFQLKRVGNEWCEITNDDKEYSTANNYQLFITDKDIYFRENSGDSWGEWQSILENWWKDKFEDVKDYIAELLDELWAAIRAEVARATAAEQTLDGKIDAETDRATAAEQGLSQRLVAEYERAAARENELEQAIEDETDRAEQVEGTLQTAIQTETTRATNAESAIRTDLNAEITRATARENAISADIADVARDLAEEIVDRQQADENLQDSIDGVASDLADEVTRAQGAESDLASDIADVASDLADEVTRAQGAEQDITDMVTNGYIPNAGNTKAVGFSLMRDSFYFGGNNPSSGGGFTIGNVPTYVFNLPSSAPLIYTSPLSGHAFTTPVINVSNAAVSLNYSSQGNTTGIFLTNGTAYYLNPTNSQSVAGREIAVKGDLTNFVTQSDIADFMPNEGNLLASRPFALTRSVVGINAGLGETLTDHSNISMTPTRIDVGHLGGGYFAADGNNHRLEIVQINSDSTLGSSINLVGNNAYLYRTTAETSAASTTSDYELIRRSDIAGLAPSSALQGYIPNAGNTTTDALEIVREEIWLRVFDGAMRADIDITSDGVIMHADNTNTFIDVGYRTSLDDITISAEDGAVTFVTDNIYLQAVDTGVTISGDTDIKIYAGNGQNLTLESTSYTTIKGVDGLTILAPDTNIPALDFGTDFDLAWFNRDAVISVYGNNITDWNNFVDDILSSGTNTKFVFDITNTSITIAANTTITNTNDDTDFDNVLRFVNCTFNITDGNAVLTVGGGHIEFENCRFVAPSYVNNKVNVLGYVYAVFKNCTFENVDIECTTNERNSVLIVENCYCSHGLILTPSENPTTPIKIMNSYFDTESMTVPTGETTINALVGGCRFATGTSLTEIRHHWNNTNVGD